MRVSQGGRRPSAFGPGFLCLLDASLSSVVHGHLLRSIGEVEKAVGDILGKWAQNQSDTYVRLQRTLDQKLRLPVVSVIRSRDNFGSVLGEGETLQEVETFLEKRGVEHESIKKQLSKLDKSGSPDIPPPEPGDPHTFNSEVWASDSASLPTRTPAVPFHRKLMQSFFFGGG